MELLAIMFLLQVAVVLQQVVESFSVVSTKKLSDQRFPSTVASSRISRLSHPCYKHVSSESFTSTSKRQSKVLSPPFNTRIIPLPLEVAATRLFNSINDNNDNNDENNKPRSTFVRFLGSGETAIVRPGVVLIAPKHEIHHFYHKSAIFIYAMGEDDESGDYLIRGVIIDHPTPFTLAEMMEGPITQQPNNPLGKNLMFRGGGVGGSGVLLLHNQEDIGHSQIGLSGIYQGGWDKAVMSCANGSATAEDFKVFFNYCEFTEDELETILKSSEGDTGDMWCAVEVDSSTILNGEWDRGECWSNLRNAVAQYMIPSS